MGKTRFGSLDGIHRIKKMGAAETTFVSAGLFIVILIVFLWVVSFTTKGSEEQQREMLEKAINRGITQCYVTEGCYPESFEYLRKNYGIIYDDTQFRVDYVIYGSNMKPTVTIINLED